MASFCISPPDNSVPSLLNLKKMCIRDRERDNVWIDAADVPNIIDAAVQLIVFIPFTVHIALVPRVEGPTALPTHIPVSYTHLDVYKRQRMHCM